MRSLSEYTGDEALDLWADLLDPITEIMSDKDLLEMRKKEGVKIGNIAKTLIKTHKAEVSEILLRIDPTPLNGINIVTRLISVLSDLSKTDGAADFFGPADAPKKPTSEGSSGSATETTEAGEN